MSEILQLLAWLFGSIVAMSFIEHTAHRSIMHRPFFLAKYLAVFRTVFERHAIVHHGQYHDVFTDAPVEPGKDRGIRLSIKEGFFESLPFAALISLISVQGAVIFVLVVLAHHYLWGKIHLEMHKPENRYFGNWSIYRYLARHHFLHHKYPSKNFNVVFPIADFIMGTNVHASAADREDLQKAGLCYATQDAASREAARYIESISTSQRENRPTAGSGRRR